MTSGGQGGGWADPFGSGAFGAPQRRPSEDTTTLATLSVVFAFVLAPVGAVLGHLALADVRRRGQRGSDRALVGLTLSYVFMVIAVVVSVVWAVVGTNPGVASTAAVSTAKTTSASAVKPSTSAPPEPLVTAAGLQTLVLTPDDVGDILKSPGMVVDKTWTQTHGPLPGDRFDPAECTDAVFNGLTESYRGSGYRAIYGLDLGQQTPGFPHAVSEFVSTFENAAAARRFAVRAADRMHSCAGKQMTYTHGGVSGIYTVGTPVESGGVTTLRSTLDNVLDNGRPVDVHSVNASAVRALAAKANVVVDLAIIGRDLGDEATTMASRIVDKIPS